MPHASFCLRDKGHFSKRNIRSLFLVLIPRTACHNAFTFCPYIWICNPSCAFEEGMQTLFFDFWVSVGHWLEPGRRGGRRLHAHPLQLPLWPTAPRPSSSFVRGCRLRWPSAGEGLFPSTFLSCCTSLPSQPASQSVEANCQTSVDGSTLSTPPFSGIFLPPVSCRLWEMQEIPLSLSGFALGSTVEMLATLGILCLRHCHVFPLLMVPDEQH